MRDRKETDEGREIYCWRKITVEPVIGQVKENFGFRQFCLRGLDGAQVEINIVENFEKPPNLQKFSNKNLKNWEFFNSFNFGKVEVFKKTQ